MSENKNDEPKVAEVSDRDLEQVAGGTGLVTQDSISVQIDHNHQTVNEVGVSINNGFEVDPLAVQIDHNH